MSSLSALLLLSATLLLSSCFSDNKRQAAEMDEALAVWSNDSTWYQSEQKPTDEQIDLFYLVSTEVMSSRTSTGEVSYLAQLTSEELDNIKRECAYVDREFCQSDINCLAPYYHQFTFEAIGLPASQFFSFYTTVSEEVCAAFDYYMKYKNQGRRFALVGFSQGGMLVLDVLRHMTDDQYKQMVAAYAIGYRITAEDMKHDHIRPATGETETGVTISYNSVLSNEGIWPAVSRGAAASINPVNWKCDATPATFTYQDQLHTVTLDTTTYQLLVEVEDASAYRAWNDYPAFQEAGVKPDCLHHYDLLFYSDYIHDNILRRAQNEQ